MTSGFKLTAKQREMAVWLGGPQRHFMVFGGSRSGKTFYLIRAVVVRAMKAPEGRHVILRQAFSHIKSSVVLDTFPKVMKLCFPDTRYHLSKTDWYATMPNGSEIWFGGLDEKERVEKILGNEYITIYLNECSQMPISSRELVRTRLAQKVEGLAPKMLYDCNPPSTSHWTYKLFERHTDPMSGAPLPDAENYTSMKVNPIDNRENLNPEYLSELQSLPKRLRDRFWSGKWGDATEHALWLPETLDRWRVMSGDLPEMKRIVIGVDPSGTKGEEDDRSNEVGIVVVGLAIDGNAYVLEDLSGNYPPSGKEGWGHMVAEAYERWSANRVVAERNFGGAMVEATIKAHGATIPVFLVTASRGKEIRAEPVAELYAQGKVRHVGHMATLEDQLLSMTTHGYEGDKSPDRLDACVWAVSDLFPKLARPARKRELVHESASGQQGGHNY